jgi:hypothetical protein
LGSIQIQNAASFAAEGKEMCAGPQITGNNRNLVGAVFCTSTEEQNSSEMGNGRSGRTSSK